jgi:ATP-binding cassette subfamily C protein
MLTARVFQWLGLQPTLVTVLAVYLVFMVLQALANRLMTTTGLAVQSDFVARLRGRLYEAIARADWLFVSRRPMAEFTHALTTEMDRVGIATYDLLLSTSTGLITLVYLAFALRVSPEMTALVLVSGSVLWLLLRRRALAVRESGHLLSSRTRELFTAVGEHLGGMKTAKSYGAEGRHVAVFTKVCEEIARTTIGAVRTQAAARFWFDVGAAVILCLFLLVGLQVLALPLSSLLVLLFLFARTMPRLSTMQTSVQRFLHALPAFLTVSEIQKQCEAAATPSGSGTETLPLRRAIELKDVTFEYDGASPALRSVSLIVPSGRTTAIVGPSGAGKSTIADLMTGLIRPSAGAILIDGQPLTPELIPSWRRSIGYVPQETFLFNDTVRNNLLWACPDASTADIEEALAAAAADFVTALPQGIDTVLGDRGIRLSGGERQRIALARALLRRPALLLLDEATSALDSENERRIQASIDRLHGEMTILIITHRLSTIRHADHIYVLEEGTVVEAGDWASLLAKAGGRFAALCAAQGMVISPRIAAKTAGR